MADERYSGRDLDWNLLKIFDQIVRSGGVSAAARQMRQNQPGLGLALKRLEERLETTLRARRCPRRSPDFRLRRPLHRGPRSESRRCRV